MLQTVSGWCARFGPWVCGRAVAVLGLRGSFQERVYACMCI